ncbi:MULTISPECIES: DUF4245 domain-containing protein [Kitasatospora]|uniref:DUF4245 domain-containing protein n=2 Tax=Kitasatospora TaxID=2063 RepID=A0ABT1IQH7_9ACTN|nr:DUF4245 domain-containing protein [Kitasatospora paracochleata]MCP2307359.1 hypothetical protein [Kitasatospora paracochleata]
MAGNSSKRGRQTVRDMILSMLAVGVVVFVGYVFLPGAQGDGVHVIDYRSALASAKRGAPYPVLGPEGLSDKWRATSVDYRPDKQGHNVWHLGFVTPSGQYAAVEQSDAAHDAAVAAAVAGAKEDGTATVAGDTWQRFQGERYRGLVHPAGTTGTTVVTGTATYEELAQLAEALK